MVDEITLVEVPPDVPDLMPVPEESIPSIMEVPPVVLTSAARSSHLHEQDTPAIVWEIQHNLDQMVVEVATVYSMDYGIQYYNVILEPLTVNSCKLFFTEPISGYALIQK